MSIQNRQVLPYRFHLAINSSSLDLYEEQEVCMNGDSELPEQFTKPFFFFITNLEGVKDFEYLTIKSLLSNITEQLQSWEL